MSVSYPIDPSYFYREIIFLPETPGFIIIHNTIVLLSAYLSLDKQAGFHCPENSAIIAGSM